MPCVCKTEQRALQLEKGVGVHMCVCVCGVLSSVQVSLSVKVENILPTIQCQVYSATMIC